MLQGVYKGLTLGRMSNDEEVGSSDGEDSLAEVGEDSSRVMMSIFESYYGIEDGEGDGGGGGSGNEAGPHRSSGDIDSVHFDPENFCRVLLQNAPLEEMLLRDTKMTHEIRALDSDMQMLVYENYNKFIAATETIKRMKSNVDAMDSDMEAVRVKMDGITSSSITLDESLDAKHGRVDKLVRVRRVLERLEFLSELPEKLESMILREEYQRAVRLYRRTIHVLTQHSQVLSFRKIKERTEAMMADLRGKVTDLLEDPGLDAVKLTQYASILRLMEADRRQVCQRLLQAHRQRSVRMLRHFSSSLTTKQEARGEAAAAAALADGIKLQPPKTPSSAPSPNVGNIGDDFSSGSSSDRARRFHQGLVVGLIEACRGLQELYGASPASLVHHRSQHNPSVTPLASRGRAASGDSIGSNSTAMATPGGSLLLSLPKEAPIPPEDIAQASAGFGSLLKEVVTSYRTSMIAAASDFFERYAAFFETHQALEAAVRDQGQGQGQGIGDSPAAQALRSSQLQLYVLEDERQAWILLARQAIADCEFCEREARKSMAELRGATPPAFSRDFSSAMLDALDVHLHQCLKRRALGFCAVLPQAEAEITALTSSFAHPGAASGGGAFPGKSVQVCRARCEALVEAVMQAQSDFCSDCKEVVDAYGSVDEAGVAAYVSGLAGAWGAGLAASCEMACGVASAALGIGAGIGSDDGDDGGMEWGSGASAPLHNTAGGLRNLLLYCVIGMLTGSPATVARMDKEWALLGLGLGLGLGPGQGRRAAGVSRRLQASGNRAFQAYVDHHARLFSDLSVGVIEAGRARDLTGSSVAPQCIELVLKLDRLAASASVVLGDGPTVFSKVRVVTRSRIFLRFTELFWAVLT